MRMRPPVCAGARARARVPAPCARLHSTRPQATATAQPGLACANAHAAPCAHVSEPPKPAPTRPPASALARPSVCPRARARAPVRMCPPARARLQARLSKRLRQRTRHRAHAPARPPMHTDAPHSRKHRCADARPRTQALAPARVCRSRLHARAPACARPSPPPTRQPAPMRRPQSHTPMAPPPPAARPADDDHSGEVLGRPSPFQGRVSARTARDAKVSLGTEAKQR